MDLYLLALEIYHDMILKDFPKDLTKELHEFIIDLEKRWVTIDGRHVNIGGDDSSGGSSGSSGENRERNKLVRGKYPTSNEEIDLLLNNEFKNIRFSVHPVYNARIASAGKTVGEFSPLGKCKKIKSMEIGKQYSDKKESLMDTIIHEELEARIMLRSHHSKKYQTLNTVNDNERHKYINRTIKRYFRLKGWNYGLV